MGMMYEYNEWNQGRLFDIPQLKELSAEETISPETRLICDRLFDLGLEKDAMDMYQLSLVHDQALAYYRALTGVEKE